MSIPTFDYYYHESGASTDYALLFLAKSYPIPAKYCAINLVEDATKLMISLFIRTCMGCTFASTVSQNQHSSATQNLIISLLHLMIKNAIPLIKEGKIELMIHDTSMNPTMNRASRLEFSLSYNGQSETLPPTSSQTFPLPNHLFDY